MNQQVVNKKMNEHLRKYFVFRCEKRGKKTVVQNWKVPRALLIYKKNLRPSRKFNKRRRQVMSLAQFFQTVFLVPTAHLSTPFQIPPPTYPHPFQIPPPTYPHPFQIPPPTYPHPFQIPLPTYPHPF